MMQIRSIKRQPKALVFELADNAKFEVPNAWLRGQCRCAFCLQPKDSEIPLFSSPEQMNAFYRIDKIEALGNYALGMTWGDKHRSIFDIERLLTEFQNLRLPAHLQALSKSELSA